MQYTSQYQLKKVRMYFNLSTWWMLWRSDSGTPSLPPTPQLSAKFSLAIAPSPKEPPYLRSWNSSQLRTGQQGAVLIPLPCLRAALLGLAFPDPHCPWDSLTFQLLPPSTLRPPPSFPTGAEPERLANNHYTQSSNSVCFPGKLILASADLDLKNSPINILIC